MNSQKSTITHPTEPHLPWGKTLLISVQHIFVSNVWLDPIFCLARSHLRGCLGGIIIIIVILT